MLWATEYQDSYSRKSELRNILAEILTDDEDQVSRCRYRVILSLNPPLPITAREDRPIPITARKDRPIPITAREDRL